MSSNKTEASFPFYTTQGRMWHGNLTMEPQSFTIPFSIRQTEVFIQAEQHHSSWNCLGSPTALQLSSFSLLLHQTGNLDAQHISFILLHSVILIPYRYIFSPHKHATKIILDAEGKSGNSSVHSQGMPGSTHRPVLLKGARRSECFHTLFAMSECFIWSEQLTTCPQHHPKRRSHLQVTLFFP